MKSTIWHSGFTLHMMSNHLLQGVISFSKSSMEHPQVASFNERHIYTTTLNNSSPHTFFFFRKLFGPAYTSYCTHITQPSVNITCTYIHTYTHPSGPSVKLHNMSVRRYSTSFTNQNHMKWKGFTTKTVKCYFWCLIHLYFIHLIRKDWV